MSISGVWRAISERFLFARAERLARARDVAGLIALVGDPEQPLHERALAAEAIAEQYERVGELRAAAAEALLRALEIDEAYVRRPAILALAQLRVAEALPAFRRAAHDPDWTIRLFAAHAFERLGGPLAEAIALLSDVESQVREAAAMTCADIGDRRARYALERVATGDRYVSVRDAAKEALRAFD